MPLGQEVKDIQQFDWWRARVRPLGLYARGVQSKRGGHGNPTQKPTKHTWQMMIFLRVKVLFPNFGAHCGGSRPPP